MFIHIIYYIFCNRFAYYIIQPSSCVLIIHQYLSMRFVDACLQIIFLNKRDYISKQPLKYFMHNKISNTSRLSQNILLV